MTKIVTVPSQALRQPTRPVTTLDKRVISVINDMIETLLATRNPEGVGLAAPQIGVPLRIFLARPDVAGPISIFINPEIQRLSQRIQPTGKKGVFEGCLSIPGHYAPVRRAMSVTVKYQTTDPRSWILENREEVFTGFPAHVIQHEIDHLNGVLFIDRVLEQHAKIYKMEGEDWVEVGI
ncbi:MAG: peptide deformylase [Patescibacteria group bacterium]